MLTKPTILYVEDEDGVRNILSKLLNHFSSELYVAKDGKVGLELFKQHLPNIVISDIKMPIMNGIDMVKAIKKINFEQHIIFTTAHSESEYLIDAIETHADGYILKPISFEILKQKLVQITKQINIEKELLAQQILTNEITQMLNLLIVLDKNNNIIYSNKNFLKFFSLSNIEQFNAEYESISSVFVNYGDFFYTENSNSWIEEIISLDDDERVISMINEESEPQAFIVSIKQMEDTGHSIVIFTEITSLAIKKNELQYKAYTDDLTKIANRTYFEDRFKKEFKKSHRDNKHLGIILFDIDHFKDLNDAYGNKIGDEILIELASIVEQNISKNDIFARWCSEKFIQLLPATSPANTLLVANRLKKLIENHPFQHEINITCSFGIGGMKNNNKYEDVIEESETALYNAKHTGRNKICLI